MSAHDQIRESFREWLCNQFFSMNEMAELESACNSMLKAHAMQWKPESATADFLEWVKQQPDTRDALDIAMDEIEESIRQGWDNIDRWDRMESGRDE